MPTAFYRADVRIEARVTSCRLGEKLYLKADKPLVGQRHWDVERKREYSTFLFSLKGLEILFQGRRGQVNAIVMEHFNSILFHKSGPANKQYTYQSIS